MRRRVLLVALLLLVGALVNFIVANGLGWFVPVSSETYLFVSLAPNCTAMVFERRGFGKRELSWEAMDDRRAKSWEVGWAERNAPGRPPARRIAPSELPNWCAAWNPDWRRLEQETWAAAINSNFSFSPPLDIAIGWPLVSWSCFTEPRLQPRKPKQDPGPVVHGGAIVETWGYHGVPGIENRVRALAWRPIWPGFVLNTIFYALLTWSLIRAPRTLRRWRRRRAGLCLACGYDLKGLAEGAPCPECGLASAATSSPQRGARA
jgi:hypothetical protein